MFCGSPPFFSQYDGRRGALLAARFLLSYAVLRFLDRLDNFILVKFRKNTYILYVEISEQIEIACDFWAVRNLTA